MGQDDKVLSALPNSSWWTRVFQGYTEGYGFDTIAATSTDKPAICGIHETMSASQYITIMIELS